VKKIFLLCIIILILAGCSPSCPESCDDDNPCTSDICNKQTKFKCKNTPFNGKQPGCSAEIKCGFRTCKDGVCEIEYKEDCCGNNKCEQGEDYQNCADDCPNCNDGDKCTKDFYDYHEKKCINEKIKPCCGNNKCEREESHGSCPSDCILETGNYIEIGIGYVNNPELFSEFGTDFRYFYSVKNCLKESIQTEELSIYIKEKKEDSIYKEELSEWPSGSLDGRFINIPNSTCDTPWSKITTAHKEREVGSSYPAKAYYKFKYKNKIYEYISPEKIITVRETDSVAQDKEGFAFFRIDNSNLKKLS